MRTSTDLQQESPPFALAFAPANSDGQTPGPTEEQVENPEAKPVLTDSAFASALAMIATLPLSDEEKAEAVRRLL